MTAQTRNRSYEGQKMTDKMHEEAREAAERRREWVALMAGQYEKLQELFKTLAQTVEKKVGPSGG